MLLLDKASGVSSNGALQSVRRLFSAAKAGHTGTLDPLATGLLPLCFGEATKFSADLLNADKTYEAELFFGVTTTTGDAEGEVIETRPVTFERAALESALGAFRGPISQIPPMYSALKRAGQPLYQLARQGIEVERAARQVTLHELQLLDLTDNRARLRVTCSKGTYIRTLAEDIGHVLGCGAHLSALRRLALGTLTLENAVTLDQLLPLLPAERAHYLLPPDALLQTLPALPLAANEAERFAHGNGLATQTLPGKYRVYFEHALLGLGEVDDNGQLKPRRLVSEQSAKT